MGKLITLGTIENRWSWEYDASTVTAKLIFEPENGALSLDVNKVHIKSGLGRGRFEKHIGRFNVGTLKNPQRGLIGRILKDNKQMDPFRRNGWFTDDKKNLTLKELFIEIYEGDNDISRALKLSELKKRIAKK
jgi:hypothetical protein